MSTRLDELRRELLQLPMDVRADLVVSLIDSLDPAVGSDEAFWIEKAELRAREIDAEIAGVRPVEEVIGELRSRITPAQDDAAEPER